MIPHRIAADATDNEHHDRGADQCCDSDPWNGEQGHALSGSERITVIVNMNLVIIGVQQLKRGRAPKSRQGVKFCITGEIRGPALGLHC
jgi:hypothetical protein